MASIFGRRYGEGVSRRQAILVTAVVSQAMISLVQFGLPALTFALRDELGIGPAQFGFLFAVVGVGSGVALALAGRACDRFGARPVLLAGSIVGAAGLAGAGLSGSTTGLAAALFVAGVGGAAVPVAGMTSILAHFPPDRRGMVLGLRQTAVPAGGALAALLLPPLARAGGLRLAFLVPAALVLVSGLAFAAAVGPGRTASRVPGRPRGPLPAGLARVILVGALYVVALGGVISFTAAAAEDAGIGRRSAEILLAVLNLGAVAARLFWGRLADGDGGRRRARTLIEVGVVGTATALIFPLALDAGMMAAVPAAVLLALGTLGFNGLVYLLAGEIAGPGRAGAAVGLASTAVFLSGAVAGPFLGLVAEHLGFDAMFVIVAGFAAAGTLVAAGLPRGNGPGRLAAASPGTPATSSAGSPR